MTTSFEGSSFLYLVAMILSGGIPFSIKKILVVFERFGHCGVDDISNIGFVDAHAEGYRGHDDVHFFVDEGVLAFLPFLVRHAGVIRRDPIALSGQRLGHFFDVGAH